MARRRKADINVGVVLTPEDSHEYVEAEKKFMKDAGKTVTGYAAALVVGFLAEAFYGDEIKAYAKKGWTVVKDTGKKIVGGVKGAFKKDDEIEIVK